MTANIVDYHVLIFSTSRPTPVPSGAQVSVRKEFSVIRLTGHDFLQIGTGGSDTTNWPGNPTQEPSQADQIITNETDPGRVYYVATDELGNFYVGDYFQVDQATGQVTLDASAFNLTGLQSIRLGSLGGLIGASVNEFSTDGTLSQNSDSKVPTQQAVKTYVDGLSGVSGNFTIGGNLTVSGTTTTINTTNTTVSDRLLELANGTTGSPTADSGIIIERGDLDNVFIGWDESEDKIRFATTAETGAATGGLTLSDATVQMGNIEASRLTVNEIIERAVLDNGGGINSTYPMNLAENAVVYTTNNSTGNWTVNARGNSTTSLDSMMNVGETMTFSMLITNGGTPYYNNGFQVDSNSVVPKWSGGSAPTSGNANSIDIYTYTVFKVGSATWTVFASVTQYA